MSIVFYKHMSNTELPGATIVFYLHRSNIELPFGVVRCNALGPRLLDFTGKIINHNFVILTLAPTNS